MSTEKDDDSYYLQCVDCGKKIHVDEYDGFDCASCSQTVCDDCASGTYLCKTCFREDNKKNNVFEKMKQYFQLSEELCQIKKNRIAFMVKNNCVTVSGNDDYCDNFESSFGDEMCDFTSYPENICEDLNGFYTEVRSLAAKKRGILLHLKWYLKVD